MISGDKEFDAARKVGAAVERVTGVPLSGFEKAPVLRYPDQATFHPLRYLRGLGRQRSVTKAALSSPTAQL